MTRTVGIVGGRGHVGVELIRLLAAHPSFEIAYVCSRELAGQRVSEHVREYRGDVQFSSPAQGELPELQADAVVLAMPNGKAAACVEAFDSAIAGRALVDPIIVDLSADMRFDDAWHYGLPELTREQAPGHRRIANPGCYATAMQLAIAPMRDALDGPVQCFGVSGYSGAGTTPSDKNDPGKKVFRKGFRTISWRAHDDNGDSLRYTVSFRRKGSSNWLRLRENLEETSLNFDTSQLPDGTYEIRLSATDGIDNPENPLSDAKEGVEFQVDNTPPSITFATDGDELLRNPTALAHRPLDRGVPLRRRRLPPERHSCSAVLVVRFHDQIAAIAADPLE